MRVLTKRWNDPVSKEDGYRLLVCRYRPRGVRKENETWDTWWPDLGPSKELHAAIYGKHGPPIEWKEFKSRYRAEMKTQPEPLAELAELVRTQKRVTLLCSSACVEPSRCHRT